MTGLWLSSINILCMHNEGLIPLRSKIVHPKAYFLDLKTRNSLSSCSSDKEAFIITGKVAFSPKSPYLRCRGCGFSSKTSACMLGGEVAYLFLSPQTASFSSLT